MDISAKRQRLISLRNLSLADPPTWWPEPQNCIGCTSLLNINVFLQPMKSISLDISPQSLLGRSSAWCAEVSVEGGHYTKLLAPVFVFLRNVFLPRCSYRPCVPSSHCICFPFNYCSQPFSQSANQRDEKSCLQHHHRSKQGEAVNGTFTFCREGDMHQAPC